MPLPEESLARTENGERNYFMRKITVTEALNELKLQDSKIRKKVESGTFVAARKTTDTLVNAKTVKAFKANATSTYDSIAALIKNRMDLKAKIIASNANTEVSIGNQKMSVAEVIDYKQSISYKEDLLDELKQQYSLAEKVVASENKKSDKSLNEILKTLACGGKEGDSANQIDSIVAAHNKANQHILEDPLGILEVIRKLEDEIDEFRSNVDTALAVSNAVTTIELEW